MRDANGVFIGDASCRWWGGVAAMQEKTCCGGKKFKVALTHCSKQKIVVAEEKCNSTCSLRVMKPRGV